MLRRLTSKARAAAAEKAAAGAGAGAAPAYSVPPSETTGHWAALDEKQMDDATSQQFVPPAGATGQLAWQSASIAHVGTHCPGVTQYPAAHP